MRAINTGNVYEIFDDSLKTFDKLPTQTYVVRFSKEKGFFLEKYADIEIPENKLYGAHMDKVNKVLRSFDAFNRNLGVILSGDKGIGKSLFAKLLSIEAIKKNIPLIVVDTYIPGIASYIESIEQEVMVLFDEFDKTFGEVRQEDGAASPQTHLLSLFDGVSAGKKLFVITCNTLHKLNEYLINRPGRFHYHFRFEYPSPQEIREYLQDKIPEERYGEIDDIIVFSRKVDLNYDCLRAIAFEINMGAGFKEAIKDLNIINMKAERYTVTLHFDNGMTAVEKDVKLDLFNEGDETVYLRDKNGLNFVDVEFNTSSCQFDSNKLINIIYPEDLNIMFDNSDDEDYKKLVDQAKSANVEHLSISRSAKSNIHYAV